MDNIQRPILLVALAVVAYLILMQWNKDYNTPTIQNPTAINTQVVNGNVAANYPSTTQNNSLTNPVPAGVQPHTSPVTAAAEKHDLIEVQTDIYNVKIDPNGGDIVDLSMKQYPETLDNPDNSIKLFSNTGDVRYKANSAFLQYGVANAEAPVFSSDKTLYKLEDGKDELKVDLFYTKDNINYVKTYTFKRGMTPECAAKTKHREACTNPIAYQIGVSHKIENQSSEPWQGFILAQLARNNAKDPASLHSTSVTSFLGMAYSSDDKPYNKVALKDVDSTMSNALSKNTPIPQVNVKGGWIAWLQHYFLTAWVGDKNQAHAVKTFKDQQGNYVVGFTGPLVTVAPNQTVTDNLELYAGPKLQYSLKELSPGLDLTVDYGIFSIIGKPIFWLLQAIHSIVGNWGWSIIILTIIIKLIFFPLSATSYRSMARMRAASPKMQAIRERYPDDKQKQSQAMMELYKKEKLNPLSGCLPILIQMPVFISLYWVLQESVEIRQAPWLGWIQDLSASDPYFILPIIMGVSMYVQQLLSPAPADPMQAKMFKIMPVAFTVFFIWFPSGLVLYWIVNNILSIAQQWVITRQIESAAKKKPTDS